MPQPTPQPTEQEKYLLVSDSNERGPLYDSKHLTLSELTSLAEDRLFASRLSIMGSYLPLNGLITYWDILQRQVEDFRSLYQDTAQLKWSGKFKVVDGQVVFIECGEVPDGMSPEEYLRAHWDITPEFTVNEITNCMLRGVTALDTDKDAPKVKNPSNANVVLRTENIPPHMHHSGITDGTGITCMESVGSAAPQETATGTRFDMFRNDSFSTGLDKNELEGVLDKFDVVEVGSRDSENLPGSSHGNMPVHHRFYAFEIAKVSSK